MTYGRYPPPPNQPNPNKGRRCHACNVNWPNSVAGKTICWVCGAATQVNTDDPDFATTEIALAFSYAELARRENQAAFKAYCEVRDTKLILDALTELQSLDELALAAQFAKLERLPTKEVTSGQ